MQGFEKNDFWDPDKMRGVIQVYTKQRITWGVIFFAILLLCVPGLIGYLQIQNVSFALNLWPSFTLSSGSVSLSLILTIYNATSSVLAVASSFIIYIYGSEIMKEKTLASIRKQEPVRLDAFTEAHAALTAGNPTVVLLTSNGKSFRSMLCGAIYIVGFAVSLYQTFMPISTTSTTSYVSTSSMSILLSPPVISANTFKADQFKYGYYFSKLTDITASGILPVHNAMLCLAGQLEPANVSRSDFVSYSPLPFMNVSIPTWNYTIVPQTSYNATSGIRSFGSYSFQNSDDLSTITIDSSVPMTCLTTVSSPWSQCTVPDVFNVTIVQRLPVLANASTYSPSVYTTDVYYLSSTPAVYVLQAQFNFTRLWVTFYRDGSSSIAKTTTLTSDFSIAESSGVSELLYRQIKIAAVLNLQHQFDNTNGYTWSQLRENIINGDLFSQFGSYSKTEMISTLLGRIVSVVKIWVTALNTNAATYKTLLSLGSAQTNVSVGPSLVFGFGLFAFWLILLVASILESGRLKKKRLNAVDSTEIRGYPIASWIDYIWSRSYGMLLFKNALDPPGKPSGLDPRKFYIQPDKAAIKMTEKLDPEFAQKSSKKK
ncbi:hypothetical protein EDD86DRAFT_206867 [Gorgonomyces haynaldii]|nr:hypothetical protein EDD86DRAFT_206867 [Gorgonomyces haynaldii]